MCSSTYIDNNGKDILIYGFGPTQGLGDTLLKAEASIQIIFQDQIESSLSLHYNEDNSFFCKCY